MANPLTDTDLDLINDNLLQLKVANDQIKLAQQAGLDVTCLKQQASDQQAQLLKLKQTYFPGR